VDALEFLKIAKDHWSREMRSIQPIANQKSTPYASKADFCRVFAEDMTGLYLLAYLLTANGQLAEQCFVSGLEDSSKGHHVFKEWALSWARRTIIQSAIQAIRPRPPEENDRSNRVFSNLASTIRHEQTLWREPTNLTPILELPSFERFVFVMSILQRYSDQDCSILLGCTPREVIAARTRALASLGKVHGDFAHEEEILFRERSYSGSVDKVHALNFREIRG
jgi:DNA-directed RNA polymerase specialized sigma24 family protein